ncbi:MAG: 30S ribosomal protein S17e [Nanoarchaeota archaeon]
MGRIKTKLVKRVTNELIDAHPEQIGPDFSGNKIKVSQLVEIRSKKLRNIVAGYATRLNKQNAKK